ncbi:MAG: DUF928 domain-containing protein [Cyanobacteria bacterium SBLK]|nr:DUF928 domain-containing protein [Cyanobacteria bacterium SBLK]
MDFYNKIQNKVQCLGILSALLGTSLLVGSNTNPATASQAVSHTMGSGVLVSVDFPQSAPSGGGTLSRTYGGGSRTLATSCLEEGPNIEPLTALIPEDTLVKTADSDPSLYVYIPKKLTSDELSATVVILSPSQSENLPEEIYVGKTIIPNDLSKGGRIVAYKLEGAALEPGKTYTWSFSIHCDPQKYDLDRFVQGVFQRVESSAPLPANLDEMSPAILIDKANEYAANAIWNETLNLTAKVRNSNPSEWIGLLQSINLPQFESIPFVSCQNNGEYCVPQAEDLSLEF